MIKGVDVYGAGTNQARGQRLTRSQTEVEFKVTASAANLGTFRETARRNKDCTYRLNADLRGNIGWPAE